MQRCRSKYISLGALHVAKIGPERWTLLRPVPVSVAPGVVRPSMLVLSVPVGFVTDFASVPRVPFIFALCGGTAHRAAVLHDWLYAAKPLGLTRAQCDKLFRLAMRACGEPVWRAWLMWLGCRLGGAGRWHRA